MGLSVIAALVIGFFTGQGILSLTHFDSSNLGVSVLKEKDPTLIAVITGIPSADAIKKQLTPPAGQKIRWIDSEPTKSGGCRTTELDQNTGKTNPIGKDATTACRIQGLHYDFVPTTNTQSKTLPTKPIKTTSARLHIVYSANTSAGCSSIEIDLYGSGGPIPGTSTTVNTPCTNTGLHYYFD